MAKKILVIDDEPQVTIKLAARLKANGYEVIAGGDAIQAIKLAREERPDLILLDVKMPAGDGFSIIQNLKKLVSTVNIPVIIITGTVGEEARDKAMEEGAEDFILKPFDSEELLRKIRKILGEDRK